MPWQGSNGFTYTTTSVQSNAPSQSGVYAIYTPTKWIYIGESQDIRARLMQHLAGDNDCIRTSGATLFAYELVPTSGGRVARQNALILECAPTCNQRLG